MSTSVDQTKSKFVVARVITDSLVDDFLVSRKGRERAYCTSFDPDGLRIVLRAFSGDEIDYAEVVQVLEHFRCSKLTAHCDSWTPWMMARINHVKYRILRAGGAVTPGDEETRCAQ